MFETLVLFFIGFIILVKGADYLIAGASSVARYFDVSPWVIGLLIVGIGTSIPEFSITLASLWDGSSIGVGTIIGSNSFNLLFILGLSSLMMPIAMRKDWVWEDLIVNMGVIVLAGVLFMFPVLGDSTILGLSREEGLFLIALFVVWVIAMLKRKRAIDDVEKGDDRVFALTVSFIMILGGLVGVFIGGKWVVDGATSIALILGASEKFVALTIVGIGTSIPELTVTLRAAMKGKGSLAVGNIIGSNIFDFLGVLGVASVIREMPFDPDFTFDIVVTFAATLLLFLSMFVGKKYVLGRWHGLFLVLTYVAYLLVVVVRG
ncbi:MAG: sodium:proton exchanger [Parcubacteria group bacterium CG11_big_fil_rev_8_21_14_0_20_39_22]|nr:MAG: sodium:proton exchanger [Parcubacteria group bacterium CG11_big_fil_rev_8_21_14_0_20_39_22]